MRFKGGCGDVLGQPCTPTICSEEVAVGFEVPSYCDQLRFKLRHKSRATAASALPLSGRCQKSLFAVKAVS